MVYIAMQYLTARHIFMLQRAGGVNPHPKLVERPVQLYCRLRRPSRLGPGTLPRWFAPLLCFMTSALFG